ncbi:hypothetical protein U9M48_020739 [Paspalum notatum var. saurae]|uniref:Uncharacterized protein n=1 Tax=Paspalum notatum var. saurae TaxID=547442 RepID=A0AAQ3THG7_PASNO
MAATATAGVTEEAKAAWWLRFNNGVHPVDDGDDNEEEEGEGAASGGKAAAAVSGGNAAYAVAGREEAEVESGTRDGRAETVVRGGGKAEAEAVGATGGKRRSSSHFADRATGEEISGGNNCIKPGEAPRRNRKIIAKRIKRKDGGAKVQKDTSQAQSPCLVLKGPESLYVENEKLRLQLALKTAELKEEENRRLKLELVLNTKETESLQKRIEKLKAENEQLRKNAKPPRVPRRKFIVATDGGRPRYLPPSSPPP